MTDQEFAIELRRHLLALAQCETHPIKRRALYGVVATVERRYGVGKKKQTVEAQEPVLVER